MADIEIIPNGATLPLPIPIYTLVRMGTMRGKDGEEFAIVAGLDRELVAQLKRFSLDQSDAEIQNNTSDRARFGEGSYEDWYGKDRVPFALIHEKTKVLAALAWFGPKPLGRKSLKHLSEEERKQDERSMDAGQWHTIVYRSYNPYRGKGLMMSFVKFVMNAYHSQYPDSKIWAGIFADNPASLGFATKLGFKVVEEHSSGGAHETVMVWSGPTD